MYNSTFKCKDVEAEPIPKGKFLQEEKKEERRKKKQNRVPTPNRGFRGYRRYTNGSAAPTLNNANKGEKVIGTHKHGRGPQTATATDIAAKVLTLPQSASISASQQAARHVTDDGERGYVIARPCTKTWLGGRPQLLARVVVKQHQSVTSANLAKT